MYSTESAMASYKRGMKKGSMRMGGILALAAALHSHPGQGQEHLLPPAVPETRLWQDPGPVQDSPSAPRLLVVHPREGCVLTGETAMRYAGRVEPATACVTLNGLALEIWDDGVFTGLRTVSATERECWSFVAVQQGQTTAVKRILRKAETAAPVPKRPLAFAARPVSPEGDYWLPGTGTLPVTLHASEEATAEYRLGPRGRWRPMVCAGREEGRGGRYEAVLSAPGRGRAAEPRAVEFRLSADGAESVKMVSRLRLGRIPDGPAPLGRVKESFGTYMKAETTFERWGNWIQRTPFPILEVRGPRVRTGFGHGPTGWLERVQVELDWDRLFGALPRLEAPAMESDAGAVRFRWPERKTPVATILDHQPAEDGDRVGVRLPGAGQLREPAAVAVGGAVKQMAFVAASKDQAPGFDLQLAGPLWGFELRCDPAFSLEFRLPPILGAATAGEPLKGLRVAIDAGHGGTDAGALGPSGLAESDANRLQADWLELHLVRMGAEVLQTRPGDQERGLDERIEAAREWKADLFVSLHFNSVAFDVDPAERSGPIVFHHYRTSEALAKCVARRLADWWGGGLAPRVQVQNFRVNRNIHFAPSILIETAYVCHPRDEARIRRAGVMEESARAIAEGIREHMDYLARPEKTR